MKGPLVHWLASWKDLSADRCDICCTRNYLHGIRRDGIKDFCSKFLMRSIANVSLQDLAKRLQLLDRLCVQVEQECAVLVHSDVF